ncbi:leucyl aminopeptidase, partial [Actinomyces sp. Z5]
MSEITTSSLSAAEVGGDVLVLAARAEADAPVLLGEESGLGILPDLSALPALLSTLGFTAALDAVVRVPTAALEHSRRDSLAPTLLVVGTGDGDDVAALRRAAGRAAR